VDATEQAWLQRIWLNFWRVVWRSETVELEMQASVSPQLLAMLVNPPPIPSRSLAHRTEEKLRVCRTPGSVFSRKGTQGRLRPAFRDPLATKRTTHTTHLVACLPALDGPFQPRISRAAVGRGGNNGSCRKTTVSSTSDSGARRLSSKVSEREQYFPRGTVHGAAQSWALTGCTLG
jgi:hypothetical protein